MSRFGKRGMSPLIATVLLMAFAVALGAVIMNITIDRQSTGECDKIKATVYKLCAKEDTIVLGMRNDKESIPLQRIQLTVLDNNVEKTLKIASSALKPGDSLMDISIAEKVSATSKVDVIAIIGHENNPVTCVTPLSTATPPPAC